MFLATSVSPERTTRPDLSLGCLDPVLESFGPPITFLISLNVKQYDGIVSHVQFFLARLEWIHLIHYSIVLHVL